MIDQILAGIKTTVSDTLGAEYAELPFVDDVSKNNFNNNHNRYGVRSGSSFETSSVTKFITVQQTFDVVLTKAYIDDGISDSDKWAKTIEAQNLVLGIYKNLVNTKANSPANVINITQLDVGAPEFIDEQKVVVITASFNVLYRFTLI